MVIETEFIIKPIKTVIAVDKKQLTAMLLFGL